MTQKFHALIIFLLFSFGISAQDKGLNGTIIDSKTKRTLAFVNIVYNSYGNGTVSTIDGNFHIPASVDVEFLKLSYLGYDKKIIDRKDLSSEKKITVSLDRTSYDIESVTVRPGINPAHRIIKTVVENRDQNNPEKMRSFSYTSYSKMYFTLLFDTLTQDEDTPARISFESSEHSNDTASQTSESAGDSTSVASGDEGLQDALDFFEKQHLFLMEFISEREFLYPDKNKETVTASRVSGFKDPSFTLLATQLQSFSFYEELISIWDRKYLNPISRGSTRKYLFVLEDTMFTDRNDTLFVISFRPLRGKNFDGLKGILHINTHKYAVQNVIAEAAEQEGIFRIKIQQKYDMIDDVQWFPAELNTDIILQPDAMQANGTPVKLYGIGKSYLSDIVLEPDLKKREFGHVELLIEDDAHKKSPDYWNTYRVIPLTAQDTATYEFIDSIGEEANIDRTLNILETIASGYIPWKFLNIDYRSIINYNKYEGFRFGFGAQTNNKLSSWFSVGGNLAYGLKDKGWKYGGNLRLNLYPPGNTYLSAAYDNDVFESAGFSFIENPPITSSEIYRTFLIRNKDIVEMKELKLGSTILPFFKMEFFLNQNTKTVSTPYRFSMLYADAPAEMQDFRFTEMGMKLRYAFKEKFMQTPRGNKISLGTKYPVIQANITRGTKWMDGDFDYMKFEGRISQTFISKTFGESSVTVIAGFIDKNIPYTNLYNGKGSYGDFTVETENSFATMRLNEFISDRFVSLFLKQNFGELLFRTEKFKPQIALVQNIGYGELAHPENHRNISMNSLDKGYFESGLLINNIINQMFIGYGVGVFYRYGPYQLDKTIDNFAFKLTVKININ